MHDTPLFYLPPSEWDPAGMTLQGQEFTHLRKALRLGPGDAVQLTNGRGDVADGRIEAIQGKKARITVESITSVDRRDSQIVVAVGWAKSLRRGWFLEKAAELEARGVFLWQAEHSQGRIPDATKANWQGQLVAGAKQSGNPWLPELEVFPGGLAELLKATADIDHRFFLWENATAEEGFHPPPLADGERALAILGPEGGFADSEVELLRAHYVRPVSLGRRVLRWETAALLCLGLCWWHKERSS